MINLLNSFFILQGSSWILMLFWESSWSNVSELGESQETLMVFQALPMTWCVTLGKALHLFVPLFPSVLIYSWVLWGRSYLSSVCTGLWFPFWALGTKNKYSHIKYFIEQCWKLFIFDGGEPTDSGCEPTPAILALASVSEPFE